MHSVFLSSYSNTRESLEELEKAVETLAWVGVSTAFLVLPNIKQIMSSKFLFTIASEIHARSLTNFYSICGQTHEFKIHAALQRARAGNSTICYRKKQIDVSF